VRCVAAGDLRAITSVKYDSNCEQKFMVNLAATATGRLHCATFMGGQISTFCGIRP
jgi:hypothetical protein